MCSPSTISNLPKDAVIDLRAKYKALAMVLGVEEPHGLSAEWDHEQPRREELDGHHPAMELVDQDENRWREGDGDMRTRS